VEQGAASSSGPLDPRQLNSALGETVTDLQALRNQIGQIGGRNNRDLANAIQNINEALSAAQQGQARFRADPSEIERIAQGVLDPLREAELELSRHLEILVEKDKIRAALEDETPAKYENEVKAYFEAVGKGK
jgi:hypothetical protein